MMLRLSFRANLFADMTGFRRPSDEGGSMTIKTLSRRAPAALALLLALVAIPFAAGTAGGSVTKASEAKPTIVLVHGAWADSSGWNDSVKQLQNRGYDVLAVATPLRSLHGDTAYLSSVLASIAGPIVLVGHSYGGMVLTNAATGNTNIKALVYIAAFAPDQGEKQIDLILMNPGSEIGPDTLTVRPYPGGLDSYITPSVFRRVFAHDVPERHGCGDGCNPAAVRARDPRRAFRPASLDDDPFVVSRRNGRPRNPARHSAVHGPASRCDHHRGPSLARSDDLPALRGDQSDS